MLTRDDVPDLADFFLAYLGDSTPEEAISDLMRYDGLYKAKLKDRLEWYQETVKRREAILAQGNLLLAEPVFPWRLACRIFWAEDPTEYYQQMGFQSEDEAIADTRGELNKVLKKLEETPVPEVKSP